MTTVFSGAAGIGGEGDSGDECILKRELSQTWSSIKRTLKLVLNDWIVLVVDTGRDVRDYQSRDWDLRYA